MESNRTDNTILEAKEATRLLYKSWRDKFVMPLLVGSLILGILALVPAVSSTGNSSLKALFISTYVVLGIVTVIRFPYTVRISVFLVSIYALGLGELFTHGILGDSLFFFISLVMFGVLLLSPQAGIAAISLDIFTFIVAGWLMLSGTVVPINPYASPAEVTDWLSAGGVIIMFGTVIVISFQRLETTFLETQVQIDTTLKTLQNERSNLEQTVLDRTKQMRRVNNIGRAVTSILDSNELLARAAYLIGDEFECYYTAIFLIDGTGQWAELKAATGDAGKVLRENKHHLDVNGKSTVGTVIRTRQIHIALDTGTNPVRFDNPLLPYTRSQIVIPLNIGERCIGALEMHSTKESAFSIQDVDTFQNMANQISIALENSHLFTEAQQSLFEMNATQQQYLQGSWLALTSENKLEYTLGNSPTDKQEIEIPLTLRDQTIGRINMASSNEWSSEQKNLIESIAAQAALALENARLVEESQSIATRERLVNDITSKIWGSTTMDSILQTTVRELGRALEAAEVDIEVSMGDNDE